jgi:hypothetical protein
MLRLSISLFLACLLLVSKGANAATEERLTVLSYHEIANSGEALNPDYSVTPTMFVRQMDWLRNNGFHFVSVDDLLADEAGRKPLPEKAVLITFDDGYRSMYDYAWPILKANLRELADSGLVEMAAIASTCIAASRVIRRATNSRPPSLATGWAPGKGMKARRHIANASKWICKRAATISMRISDADHELSPGPMVAITRRCANWLLAAA